MTTALAFCRDKVGDRIRSGDRQDRKEFNEAESLCKVAEREFPACQGGTFIKREVNMKGNVPRQGGKPCGPTGNCPVTAHQWRWTYEWALNIGPIVRWVRRRIERDQNYRDWAAIRLHCCAVLPF